MKKGGVVVIIVTSCLLLTYVLFQISRVKSYDHNQSLKAIPTGAAVIIKADNIKHLKKLLFRTIDFKEELFTSNILSDAIAPLAEIDSISTGLPDVMEDLQNFPFYCTIHEQGKESIKALYMLELPNKKEEQKIKNLIKGIDPTNFQINERQYNSNAIYELKNLKKKKSLFFFIEKGVALVSSSNLLIESSIRQLQSPDSWIDSEAFQQIQKTVGASSRLNVFINFTNLPGLLKPFIGESFKTKVNAISDQSKWAELDVDISENSVLLNGFITGNDVGIYSHLMTNAQPQKVKIQDVLPGNTRAYLALSLESGNELKKRIANYHQDNTTDGSYHQNIEKIRSQFKFNIEEEFYNLLTGEMALAYSDYNHLQPSANGLTVFKLNSKSKGEELVLEMLRKMHRQSSQAEIAKVYYPDNDVSFKIYRGFSNNIIHHFFSPFLPKVPSKYLAFYDNNLVMADETSLIEQFIRTNMLNRTLGNSKTHQAFLRNFSSRENLFAFCESAHFSSLFGTALEPLLGEVTEEQKEALNNFYGVGLQLSGTGKMIYSTIYMQYMPARESEPRTIWQSLLDSTVYTKPVLVKNHYSQEREVIVQDNANNLYLLSNNGRMLWKKPLDSPIMSEIVQIDYYRNNKLQYLFNTKKSIYLLDRNGNHVANFPIKLPSPASNGIAVFDYDNDRQYRFFIACENRKIYLYDSKGNIVSGWKFDKTEGIVNQTIQYFRSNSKDYIVFSDDKRNYICNRKGHIRVKLKTEFIRSSNSPYFIENKNTANDYLVTTNSKGHLMKICLDNGQVESNILNDVSDKHALSSFNMNGQDHYIFSEPKRVTCYNNKGSKVFEREFDNEINLKIDHYQFSSQNIKFGVTEFSSQNIYLLNSNGKVYKGFPLKGCSRFSIGFLKSSSSRFNLIVGGLNNYIYNYQVD